MHHHHHGQTAAGEPVAQGVGDPLRQQHGVAGVDTQAAQMRHGFQPVEQGRETCVRQAEGITAAEDDLAEAFVPGDNGQRRIELPVLGIGEVAAETVTAVGRAAGGHDEQRPAPPCRRPDRQRSRDDPQVPLPAAEPAAGAGRRDCRSAAARAAGSSDAGRARRCSSSAGSRTACCCAFCQAVV